KAARAAVKGVGVPGKVEGILHAAILSAVFPAGVLWPVGPTACFVVAPRIEISAVTKADPLEIVDGLLFPAGAIADAVGMACHVAHATTPANGIGAHVAGAAIAAVVGQDHLAFA